MSAFAPTRGLARVFDSDLWYSFTRSPVVVLSAVVAITMIGAAVLAPWIAPHDPFNLATLDLLDAFTPPVWNAEGDPRYLLGTDDQGRDVLSTIMHGARISLFVGFCSVVFAMALGVTIGLVSVMTVRIYATGVLLYGQRPGLRGFIAAARRAG